MQRNIVLTGDGSATIHIPEINVSYHSKHGAIQESMHIYIGTALDHYHKLFPGEASLAIFEMGFGTGLNALLTCQYAQTQGLNIYYEAIETAPLTAEEITAINHASLVQDEASFAQIHQAAWSTDTRINDKFTLRKIQGDIASYRSTQQFHIIYFDAFAPEAQPELWTENIFKKLYDMLLPSGVLVTYCSKVVVQRGMRGAGFIVSKEPGPWGKREILRAVK